MTLTLNESLLNQLDEALVTRALRRALATGGEFAEIFAEDKRGTFIGLDDGRIEDLSSGREVGAGVRVVVGNTTGFAHTADLSEKGLFAAAEAASGAARSGGGCAREVALQERRDVPSPSPAEVLPTSVARADKVEMLRKADAVARQAGQAVRQVSASYGEGRRQVLVANSEGLFAGDDQVRVRFRVHVVASGDTGMQTGTESRGATMGFEAFERFDIEDMGRRAAERALRKLSAKPAPSGTMPVVIKSGSGGVLFHEACGHGLEADHIAKAVSVFAGKVGEQVASHLVTLVDDGTMSHEWGALAIDDEGHPTSRNVLIDNGVLTDYMWDWLRARKEGRPTPSNGRRESYQHLPMVRMTNTFLANGAEDPEEIIRQTPRGIYIAQFGGGQVDTTTGDFVFGMTEAYLIEQGQLTHPLRDANLIGNGPQVLRDIDAVGNDFAMGWPGTCGKQGQGVPVGMGQPTLRVAALTVGGTAR
ncbi:MAG TPA: TldD/PmbA family protein [Acidimicrobiales bacterium]|nr:TldD/PmbA family protein [Acidimicrobiales bacterium]